MSKVQGPLGTQVVFLLQLLLLLHGINSAHLHHPLKLLQSNTNTSAQSAECPQATFQCIAPPCSIWPCLQGWTAQNDFCACKCNCTSPPGFAGTLPPES